MFNHIIRYHEYIIFHSMSYNAVIASQMAYEYYMTMQAKGAGND